MDEAVSRAFGVRSGHAGRFWVFQERQEACADRYVLFVVTSALTGPVAHTFQFVTKSKPARWRSDLGEDLVLEERKGGDRERVVCVAWLAGIFQIPSDRFSEKCKPDQINVRAHP